MGEGATQHEKTIATMDLWTSVNRNQFSDFISNAAKILSFKS
jgi:hypothetical protein